MVILYHIIVCSSSIMCHNGMCVCSIRVVTVFPYRWNNLKKKVSLTKQRVSPHVQAQAEVVMEVCLSVCLSVYPSICLCVMLHVYAWVLICACVYLCAYDPDYNFCLFCVDVCNVCSIILYYKISSIGVGEVW